MVNFWSSMVGVTLPPTVRQNELPSALPDPKKVSLSQFMRWSLADQIAFIEAKGTGTTPKTVTIGDPGKQGDPDYPKPTITLGYKATSPQALTYADPLLQPAQVSKNDFMRWSPDNQLAYIARFKDASGAVYLGASQSKVEVAANGNVMALGVLLPTAGDAEPIPYHHLPGSAAGTPSNVVVTSAEWLFPTLDGKKVTLPVGERPAAFSTTPAMLAPSGFTDDALPRPPGLTKEQKSDAAKVEFLKSFATWHSVYQLEYIKTHQLTPATPANSRPRLDIEVGSPELRLTAFVSPDDPTKHFIVQSLDKAAIARMTENEQSALTNMGEAWDTLSASLGLIDVLTPKLAASDKTANGGTIGGTPPTGPFTAAGYADELIYAIENTPPSSRRYNGTSLDQPQLAWDVGGTSFTVGGTTYLKRYAQTTKPADPPGNGPGGVLIGAHGGTLRYVASGSMTAGGPTTSWELVEDVTSLPDEAKQAFISQLEILKEQIGNSAIVDYKTIQTKVDELRERFNRVFAFYNVRPATAETWYHNNPDDDSQHYTVTVYADVISQDGTLNSANRGYAVFLAQEQRIAELAKARMTLVRENGILNGKTLDVPYLVYKFQSLYNLSLEAQVVAETEEVNQQNDLLRTYAAMQDAVNRTLSALSKTDNSSSVGILGLASTDTEVLENEANAGLLKVLSMFEDYLSARHRKPDGAFVGGQRHPLEVLRSVTRPIFNLFYNAKFGQHNEQDNDGIDAGGDQTDDDDNTYTKKDYDLETYTHTQWSNYATRLSESVTIINQNSQIKMNDINSMDKERNRHFELANNALAKMADIISNIARA